MAIRDSNKATRANLIIQVVRNDRLYCLNMNRGHLCEEDNLVEVMNGVFNNNTACGLLRLRNKGATATRLQIVVVSNQLDFAKQPNGRSAMTRFISSTEA